MRTLIARWNLDQDPSVDMPARIFWANGRPATLQDYLTHRLDTREVVVTLEGITRRMYPNLIADVRFDYYRGTWFVVPPGEEPLSLDLPSFGATDEEITAALSQLPRVYRAVIHR